MFTARLVQSINTVCGKNTVLWHFGSCYRCFTPGFEKIMEGICITVLVIYFVSFALYYDLTIRFVFVSLFCIFRFVFYVFCISVLLCVLFLLFIQLFLSCLCTSLLTTAASYKNPAAVNKCHDVIHIYCINFQITALVTDRYLVLFYSLLSPTCFSLIIFRET